MEAPIAARLIVRMSARIVDRTVRGLTGRRGAIRLLRLLGFTDPPAPLRGSRPPCVRTLLSTGAELLRAHVAELDVAVEPARVRDVARHVRDLDPVTVHLHIVAGPGWDRVAIACETPDRSLRTAVIEPRAVRPVDLDIIAEMVPTADEGPTAMALRFTRALDRSRTTSRFFRDIVAMRDHVAGAWRGIAPAAHHDRQSLALLFLSRLLFLYFLQRRGQLGGDPDFLLRLLREWRPSSATSFFRARLHTLFFGVLNRRPERRTTRARALGGLPYLNGGLFEEHALERRNPALDLPDDVTARVFMGLLEKYRFTTTEAAQDEVDGPGDGGIDPEMLGRIFEGLMPTEQRGRTGSFYTPPAIVDSLLSDVLTEHLAARCDAPAADIAACIDAAARGPLPAAIAKELARLRLLDPACGSGAFLMGALVRIARLRARSHSPLDSLDVRRDIVARCLHGVDLLDDAALICSLRLWLALIPPDPGAPVPPLPNLDRRIRQGDALVDPLDLGTATGADPLDTPRTSPVRRAIAALAPAAARYLGAGPEEKPALRRELARHERTLARLWIDALANRLDSLEREMSARAADRDLFGQPMPHARAAGRRLAALADARRGLDAFSRDVAQRRSLPFFSFRVHFAEAAEGFDIIVSNPPWVRAHRWPAPVRRLLRQRYRVCADAGWPEAARLARLPTAAGAQVDLSLLFLERSIELLAPTGTLGMLLPAKLFRSLYAGGARRLFAERLLPLVIDDHSLDHRNIFDADAFTAVLVARRATPPRNDAAPHVRITLRRAGGETLRFTLPFAELPLRRGDPHAPWILAPPDCLAAFRRMQREPALGDHPAVAIRRGVMTGCNQVLVLQDVEARLGGLARVRAEGHGRARATAGSGFAAYIEDDCIRPALRGSDIAAWRTTVTRHVVWVPANDDPASPTPPRLRRYLLRHRAALAGNGAGNAPARTRHRELGMLHRLGPHTLGHKVAWADLATSLEAVAVPESVRARTGRQRPVVPLNTVYFIATCSRDEALLLAAYLNSLPLRTLARATAERAKDAHFRFFAWTIATLPLPAGWRDDARSVRLRELSGRAHGRGAILPDEQRELDSLVADAFGLAADDRAALRRLDAWFRGPEKENER